MVHRVALVASSFAPHVGGVETHVREVARELRSAGAEVEIWTVDRGEHLGEVTSDGVLVRYLPTPLPRRSVEGLADLARLAPAAARAWWRAYRAFRPEVLNIQCFGPNGLYAYGLHRVTRTPLVVSSHGETFMDPEAFESALARRGLARAILAGSVTACSSVVGTDLRGRFGAGEVALVPNGVSAPVHAVPHDRAGPVVGVGRVEHVKGFDLLIRAYAALAAPRPGLVVAGDGPQLEVLRGLAAELGILDDVTFPGWRSPEQVHELFERASVVVVPSRREAFGIVVLEAWRAGAPLVTSSQTGPATFVRSGEDGLLVDPNDVPELTAAIARLLTDPSYAARLGAAGRRRVAEFTWSRAAQDYLAVYDAALADRASR